VNVTLAACDAAASCLMLTSFTAALSSQEMDIVKMLAEMRQEREQLNEAIAVLQRIAYGRGKRRGRPPA